MSNQSESGEPDSGPLPTECEICWKPPINAVQLDCGHVFCFSCVRNTRHCGKCRKEIGIEFNFQEHNILGALQVPFSEDGHYWFYEGFRGWWLYDAESNRKIERAHKSGEQQVAIFLAGAFYVIDLVNMTQQREDKEGRVRKICRNTLNLDNILGMGSIRIGDLKDTLDMMKMSAPSTSNQ